MPQLFPDLPVKTKEATSTFQVLEACVYIKKSLGDSGQHEAMTCDCHESWDPVLQRNTACGDDSGCINRVTSVECVPPVLAKKGHALSCGDECQNQRFQRKQYANVEVIETERKGYGLRAERPIVEGQFIYEYIGEVIDEATFRKRMIDYDTSNFKHFYFMMLKKDSFIDATVKGSLARFCNHSCSPNAYVDKWVVGDKLKMGIFAKRAILAGEEITFDYNVDRYGAQSQPCYCGEDNCLKFMGGKTQTDLALLLPDGISDSLGVTPQQEKAWLRENKHLRTKQQLDDAIINEAFVRSIEPQPLVSDFDVSRVMGALLKSQDKYIVEKLVQRIHMTGDQSIHTQIIRMHGYKTLSQVVKQHRDDTQLLVAVLQILVKWPKVTRNKISLSQIEDVVLELTQASQDPEIRALGAELLAEWSELEMAYRIPKVVASGASLAKSESPAYGTRSRSPERRVWGDADSENGDGSDVDAENEDPLPDGWESSVDANTGAVYYFHRELGVSRWDRPVGPVPKGPKIDPSGEKYRGMGEKHREAGSSDKYRETCSDSEKQRPRGRNGAGPGNGKPSSNGKGPSNGPGTASATGRPSMSVEEAIAQRESQRLQKEREGAFRDLQNNKKLLQDVILQSQREAEEKKLAEEKKRRRDEELERERQKRKLRHKKASSSEFSGSSGSSGDPLASWTKLFARSVPNMIKKHESEVGRDTIKQCAKEIVKSLAEKETKKHSDVPSELDKHKAKKIHDFSKTYMEKFLTKYRSKKSKKREGVATNRDPKRQKH